MTDLVEKVAGEMAGDYEQNWFAYKDDAKRVVAIVLEEAAKVARMREIYWQQKFNEDRKNLHSCALSLCEECGDIANAIRALGDQP